MDLKRWFQCSMDIKNNGGLQLFLFFVIELTLN